MKTLVVIPCRGGSKGVPYKNMRSLLGRPLLAFPIQVATNSGSDFRVVVTSEDRGILDEAQAWGAMNIVRPAALAEDTTPTLPVVQHALEEMERRERCRFESVIVMQATTPLSRVEDLKAVASLLGQPDTDSAVSVVSVHRFHPSKVKKIEGGYLVSAMEREVEGQRRQALATFFRRNGAIYGTKRETLIDLGSLYGSRCRPHLMPEELSLEIDSEFDWALLEAALGSRAFRERLSELGWRDFGIDKRSSGLVSS